MNFKIIYFNMYLFSAIINLLVIYAKDSNGTLSDFPAKEGDDCSLKIIHFEMYNSLCIQARCSRVHEKAY